MAAHKKKPDPEPEIIPPGEDPAPRPVAPAAPPTAKNIWVTGGPSPNPTGRPAGHASMMAYARQFTYEAMDVIVGLLRDTNEESRVRLVAAQTLLERGWGKVPQAQQDDPGNQPALAPEELVQARTRVMKNLDKLLQDEVKKGKTKK